MNADALIIGVVAGGRREIDAWKAIADYLGTEGLPIDLVYFSAHPRMNEFLLSGYIDLAWNTPMAHLSVRERTHGRAISVCMRDTDRDLRSVLLVRRGAAIKDLRGLVGRPLAVGCKHSVASRILPLHFLSCEGVDLNSIELQTSPGACEDKADSGRCERAVFTALCEQKVEAGLVSSRTWRWQNTSGRWAGDHLEVLWTSPPFDSHVFDAVPPLWSERSGEYKRLMSDFQRLLCSLRWEDPNQRRLLKPLGHKRWLPAREQGYQSLQAALGNQMPGKRM